MRVVAVGAVTGLAAAAATAWVVSRQFPIRFTSTIGYLHAENRRFADDGRYLDPRRPEG